MKMKNLLLSLSLAGLCLSQASAQVKHPTSSAPPPAARHIGDGVKSIGDSNRFVALPEDVRPDEFRPKGINAKPASYASALDLSMLAPAAASVSSASYTSGGIVSSSAPTDKWLSAETLLWFSDSQSVPPLVTTSTSPTLPVAGATGVMTAFGGSDGIDRGILPGFRLAAGKFLDDDQKVGLGSRVFGIFSNNTNYTASSDGTTALGIPVYDLQLQANDAFLVAYHDGVETVSDGWVSARSDLDVIGAEGSFHVLLGRSDSHRSDLLIGYSYNRLKNSVGITSLSVNRATGDLIPDGTVFRTNDLFETENTFNGAHLGVISTVTANRVSLETLAKVSFGNMRQTSAIRGFATEEYLGTTTGSAGGVLTQPSNIGSFSTDAFAFIPELGLKLGYSPTENTTLSVGYTFMFWSSVGLAGDQIDSTVDYLQLGGRPAAVFQDSSFWMQGIDLGLTCTF